MPRSVLRNVALRLDLQDFTHLLQCSSGIHSAINTSEVWHQRFQNQFGQRLLDTLDIPRPSFIDRRENASSVLPNGGDLGDHQWIIIGLDKVSNEVDLDDQKEQSRDLHTQRTVQECQEQAVVSDDAFENTRVRAQLVRAYQRFSRTAIPASEMRIAHADKARYWVFAQTTVSRFGTVAVLRSVWWMDIIAVFYGVDLSPEARYRVQWRLRTENESAIVGSEFRAVIFGKDEDPLSTEVLEDRAASMSFKPETFSAYAQHTDLNQGCSCTPSPKPRLPSLSSDPPPSSRSLLSRTKGAFYNPSYWTRPVDTSTHPTFENDPEGTTPHPAHIDFRILTLPQSIVMDKVELPFAKTTGGIVLEVRPEGGLCATRSGVTPSDNLASKKARDHGFKPYAGWLD
ncbi:unnamed protein product [Mortierella alpina]